ncbi:MAG: tRNA glutamyl-Q(34) synthetase GluQRS [Actinomycetaceae bacterium]|nr:tRNA glutamyl-Q(34) synthetase GluQRS [Actinomycetaceae bacterium]
MPKESAGHSAATPSGAGRFAPSPSGEMHIGNLRTAILAWIWARRTGRQFFIRIEDIDRERSGFADQQLADLAAIGLDWDGDVIIQSQRRQAHEEALLALIDSGQVFECYCSRRDIREAASAPHIPPGHYPGTCLDLPESERHIRREKLAESGRIPALRFQFSQPTLTINDQLYGEYTGPVDHFVVRRNDGIPAYNLAVVVDDAFQGVDQVVRGDDLLSQSPAQAALASALDLAIPTYIHVPLAVTSSGARLAKRDGAATIADLAALGWSVADILQWIGESLGVDSARSSADIYAALDIPALQALSRDPWIVAPPSSPKN